VAARIDDGLDSFTGMASHHPKEVEPFESSCAWRNACVLHPWQEQREQRPHRSPAGHDLLEEGHFRKCAAGVGIQIVRRALVVEVEEKMVRALTGESPEAV
jgi:hypothetical protein